MAFSEGRHEGVGAGLLGSPRDSPMHGLCPEGKGTDKKRSVPPISLQILLFLTPALLSDNAYPGYPTTFVADVEIKSAIVILRCIVLRFHATRLAE